MDRKHSQRTKSLYKGKSCTSFALAGGKGWRGRSRGTKMKSLSAGASLLGLDSKSVFKNRVQESEMEISNTVGSVVKIFNKKKKSQTMPGHANAIYNSSHVALIFHPSTLPSQAIHMYFSYVSQTCTRASNIQRHTPPVPTAFQYTLLIFITATPPQPPPQSMRRAPCQNASTAQPLPFAIRR